MPRINLFQTLGLAAVLGLCASTVSAQLLNASGAITLDGDPTEWGALDGSLTDNTGGIFTAGTVGSQYQWKDALDDDLGDGDYTYPTDATFDGKEADIAEFRVAYDYAYVYFLIRGNATSDNDCFGAYGGRYMIYIDRPDVAGGSSVSNVGDHAGHCQSADVNFGGGFAFDYHVSNRAGYQGTVLYTVASNNANYGAAVSENENKTNGTVELRVPWTNIGGYPTGAINLKLVAGAATDDSSNVRGVKITAAQYQGGGGCDDLGGGCDKDNDADLFDLIGSANQTVQNSDLTTSGSCAAPPVITNSIVTINANPTQGMGVTGAGMIWGNNLVRFQYTLAATGATVTNTANYTVVNDSPDNITVTAVNLGSGSQAGYVFLTLSRDITVTDTNVQVQVSTSVVSDTAVPVASGTVVGPLTPLNIIPVTMDASADLQEFLGTPYVQGSWDGYNFGFLLADGTDPYADIPGSQVEAGDTASDRIWKGRVWTTATVTGRYFVIKSNYNFGSLVAPLKNPIRQLVSGYWGRSYDLKNDGEAINLTKPFLSRLLANPVTVTINLQIPTTELTSGQAATALVYVQAGGAFGSDSALPTSPSTDLPGDADVWDGKLMTYVNTTGSNNNFTTTVTYPAMIPDVTGLRFGYKLTGFPDVRETEAATAGQHANAGQSAATSKNDTVHIHLYRVASDTGARSVGRTLAASFNVVNVDIPAPPSDGLTEVEGWNMYE